MGWGKRFIFASLATASLCTCKTKPRSVVLYFHGSTTEESVAQAEIATIRRRLDALGFDVVAPLGKRGMCDWNETASRLLCFPSDERKIADAERIATTCEESLRSRRPTFVVGFSNGSAFAVLGAAHALFGTRKVIALHGVPAGELHVSQAGTGEAIVHLVGGRKATWETPQMEATATALRRQNWTVTTRVLDGGHELGERELDVLDQILRGP